MTLANFIVIGAPKAGTTALYWYLAEHPQIFMSPVKETNYFAFGLDDTGRLLYGRSDLHRFPIRSVQAYEHLFEKAADATAIGEASPVYLECPQAAARMREQIPEARIICGLRNPADRAYSDYQMYLRDRGLHFDASRDLNVSSDWVQPVSHWMRVSRYHESLGRYFDNFPRDRIHVFLFDEFKQNPRRTVQDIYRFLGVDPDFVPDLATPYNVGGVPANMLLERVFTGSATVRAAVEPWVPKRAINWARRLRASNMQKAPELPAELRQHIMDRFREDIARTSALIGRSLDGWLQPDFRKAG